MRPNFALLLSEDGIVLLRRENGGDGVGEDGWVNVDEISLDAIDLPKGMRRLCDTAHRLSDGAFTTKLLLPQSQLLYTEIKVSDNADADIRAALEDLTPYTADQMVFDASGNGDTRRVVAVARETLSEAAGFISQFGFNPTGFSTIPPEGTFEGEPNLGDFENATFVPDTQAVKIIEAPKPVDEPEPEAAAPAPTPDPTSKPKSTASKSPDSADVVDTPAKATAAFSSRRQGDETDADRTGERLTKRAPRIAIPDKTSKVPAPRVQIPMPDDLPPEPQVKAPAAGRPVPPIIPVAAPETKAPKPSPLARFRREKPARPDAEKAAPADPLAALAAKQNAGKPRFLGLILTAVLLAALGLFAVLSSALLPDGRISGWFGGSSDTPVEVTDISEEEASDLEDFENAFLQDAPNLPGTAPVLDELPIDQDLTEPLPDLPVQITTPEAPASVAPTGPLDEAGAQTAYVSTGIWQRAPDFGRAAAPDTLDNLYVASLDPDPAFEDAPALPAQSEGSSDTQQTQPKAPPPPGVRYDLDARGLVRPTPTGALSPEGVIVFAGPPPVAPIQRDNSAVPSGLAPALLDDTQPEPVVEPTPLATPAPAQTGPFADPALAGFKPRQRPGDLSERVERALLGGKTRNELAQLRPGQRPQAILDQAEIIAQTRAAEAEAQAAAIQTALAEAETSAADQERAASLIPLDDVAANDTGISTEATALAIATSIKPPARPRGFETLVRSARSAPTPPPQAEPEVQTASAVRGTGAAVARASRARPNGQTTNAVARAATDNNAISLGQVSLVGVFGTSSSRRALVRLPNGRFKKVSIGDRVDGGRVAAIGASELRYTKSGRTLTLKMPKG